MKITNRKFYWLFAALFLFVFFFFETVHMQTAKAEERAYTPVMTDLSKDENFDVAEYPEVADDYSLKVIAIAESSAKELFLYVYQPSDSTKDFTATAINMTATVESETDGNKDFSLYTLMLLSTDGVFDKYLVKDFKLLTGDIRFYEIAAIYRAFDETVDEKPEDDNSVIGKAYNVGQFWIAKTQGETVSYSMDIQETIKVESKHVGFIRYQDFEVIIAGDYTDSHYVAFSTDKPIDKLMQADIVFSYQKYYKEENTYFLKADKESISQKIPVKKRLYRDDIFSHNSWFPAFDDYKYNRIQSVDTFLKNETEEFSEETKTALSNKTWVLRFYESGYSHSLSTSGDNPMFSNTCETWRYEIVSDVTILRLKYEYNEDVYDIGVVDDITRGDETPDNDNWDKLENVEETMKLIFKLFALLAVGVIFVLLAIYAQPVLIAILKVLWWIVCLPFRLLGWIFKGIGELWKKGKKK